MATDAEIEATRKKSAELQAQFEKLGNEALDHSKSLEPLLAAADKECARLAEVLKRPNPPKGAGIDCAVAAMEMIGDWCDLEVQAIEGLVAVGAGQPGPAAASSSPGARPGMRRGMRI